MKKSVLGALALMTAPVMLTACGSDPAPEAEAPEGVGLEIANARLVLPAVDGNPAAVYFDLTNTNDKNIAVGAASVEKSESSALHGFTNYEGYEPEMIELVPPMIPAGETLQFKPADKHVMVMGLDESVKEGDTLELTLTIAGGDKQSFPIKVLAPGDGMLEE